ncbi:MAG: RNA polymerase sigma factor, partial [Flammeovirgaceae bacterium]
MPPQSDLATILKAKAGDAMAFRQLVETYQSYLYSVAFRYLGVMYEAEDAVQETFVKTWKNLHKYRSEIKFSTWVYKILINHCLDVKKQRVFR